MVISHNYILLFSLLVSLVCLPEHSVGKEFNFQHDFPGTFSAPVSSQRYLGKTDAAAYKNNLVRLSNLLAKQPVFSPPHGIEVIGYFRPNDEMPKGSKVPFPGFGTLRFHFYFTDSKTGKADYIRYSADEIQISINNPVRGFEPFNASFFPSPVLYEPRCVGKLSGFPIYRTRGGSEVIILTRNGDPPWQPLTREEFLKGEITRLEKEAADSPPMDTITPQILRNHRTALSNMPAEERKMQARYFPSDPFQPMLAPAGSNSGNPLVRINPGWYDPKLPRTAFQLITFNFGFGGSIDPDNPNPPKSDNIAPYRLWQALHTSDWKEVSGALTYK